MSSQPYTTVNAKHNYLILIGGPTAAGKTALAIAVAQRLHTVVLSADSRQFYRELNVGVARPSPAELASVPHYFIADRSIHQPLSAGQYAAEALALLDQLYTRHQYVVAVGGSGLYLQALAEGLDEFPAVPPEVRAAVEDLYARAGLPALQEALAAADPEYYAEVDAQNPARLLRALAVCRAAGRPYSSFRTGVVQPRPFTPLYFQPAWTRQALYHRINQRVDQMWAQGLPAEAEALYPWRDLNALRTVGYQELFDHFDGRYDLAMARQLIQQHSRNYAKRQLTWLRRQGHWQLVDAHQPDALLHGLELAVSGGWQVRLLPAHQAAAAAAWLRPHTPHLPTHTPGWWLALLDGRSQWQGMAYLERSRTSTAWLTAWAAGPAVPLEAQAWLLYQALRTAECPQLFAWATPAQAPAMLAAGLTPAAAPTPPSPGLGCWAWGM